MYFVGRKCDSGMDKGVDPVIHPYIRVMTWNIAHGRGASVHQLLLSKSRIESNLRAIADILVREDIAIAAMQELDIFSFWNGGFSHLDFLQSQVQGLRFGFTGEHMSWPKLRYGTGILSSLPFSDRSSHRFADSAPMPRKGFVVGTASWPGDPDFQFDVVSLHLDFLRSGQRTRQAQTLIETLRERHRPCIVLGDFNSTWFEASSAVRLMCERLRLRAFEPEDTSLSTFFSIQKRWDWILLSKHFTFLDYQVHTDRLSDHRAISAVIGRV